MDEEQQQAGNEGIVQLMEGMDDVATVMIGMRNRLTSAGFGDQAAEAAALQHQGLMSSMAFEQFKASLRPKGGLFG